MGFCGSSLCSGSGLPESEIYDGLTLTIENSTLLPHKSVIFNKSEERKRFCGSSWCGGFPREWNLWGVGKWRAVKTGRGYLRNILQISCPFLFILLDYSSCLIHIPLCRFLYLWIILQVLLEIFPSNLCLQNLTVWISFKWFRVQCSIDVMIWAMPRLVSPLSIFWSKAMCRRMLYIVNIGPTMPTVSPL